MSHVQIRPECNPRMGLRILLCLVMLSGSLAGCHSGESLDRAVNRITSRYRFGLLRWELGQLRRAATEDSISCPQAPPVQIVRRYFALRQEIDALQREYEAEPNAEILENLEEADARRDRLRPCVVRIMSRQVADAYRARGIRTPLDRWLKLPVTFPPVSFVLEDPPHILVVSPRDRIASVREAMLVQDLSMGEMEEMEDALADLGYSALVVEIGGLGVTYPPFVADNGSLSYTVGAVAEEWLHQYLAFTPLGFRYLLDLAGIRRDYKVATMNETLAGIVQEEIQGDVLRAYYGWEEPRESQEPLEDDVEFDFRAEMRRIRIHVDALLSSGYVEQAESYMREQRDYLAQNGYYIRKLNQAYFAFHGTYAETPASTSPIGAELRQLRERSASLSAFLNRAVTMTSRQDLLAALGSVPVSPTVLPWPTAVPSPTAGALPSLKPNCDACGP